MSQLATKRVIEKLNFNNMFCLYPNIIKQGRQFGIGAEHWMFFASLTSFAYSDKEYQEVREKDSEIWGI